MESKIMQLIEQNKMDKAITMTKKLFENAKDSSPTSIAVAPMLSAVRALVLKLSGDGKINACKEVVDEFLSVLKVSPDLSGKYIQQLGLIQVMFRMMRTRKFSQASQMLDLFGLKEDQTLVNNFFQTLVKQAELKLAFEWIEKIDNPSFYTKEKLVHYLVKTGKIELALNAIKDHNLYQANATEKTFDVFTLITLLIRRGGIKEAIPFAKDFGLKDDNDFDNEICPELREVNIVKHLFNHRQWEHGFNYINKSIFKKRLEELFEPQIVIVIMIRKKDWSALSKYLKRKEILEELDRLRSADGEQETDLKTDMVKTLIEDQEYAKATKYAIKFGLLDKFPLSFLLDNLIKRQEFGELNHVIKKLKPVEELDPLKEAYMINKIVSLKHFRRRFGSTPCVQHYPPNAIEVDKVNFAERVVELPIGSETPIDDEYLVNSDLHFINFVEESNQNLLSSNDPPGISPKLQQYVNKKTESMSKMQNRHAEARSPTSSFKINPKAAEWSPDMQVNQMQQKLRGMNFANPRNPTEGLRGMNGMGSPVPPQEKMYDKLRNVMGTSPDPLTMNGYPRSNDRNSPLAMALQAEEMGGRPRYLDSNGLNSNINVDAGMFQGRESFASRGHVEGAGLTLQGNPSGFQDELQRTQMKRLQMERQRREMGLARVQQVNSMRGNLEALNRRERIEKLIAGLLNLNKEAQIVRRNLALISQKYQQAVDDHDYIAKQQAEQDYHRLRLVKEQHRAKEKRVLLSARNDADVAEAVAEFQRRRRSIPSVQGNQISEHQQRQLHRLQQHEAEKQRQEMMRRQQMQQQQNINLQQLYQQREVQDRFSPEYSGNRGRSPINGRLDEFSSNQSFAESQQFNEDHLMQRQNSLKSTFSKSRSPTEFDYFGNFDESDVPNRESSFGFTKQSSPPSFSMDNNPSEENADFSFNLDAGDFTFSGQSGERN